MQSFQFAVLFFYFKTNQPTNVYIRSPSRQLAGWLARQTDRQPRPWLKRKVIASSSSSNREAEKTQSCHRRQLQTLIMRCCCCCTRGVGARKDHFRADGKL
ncbi:Glutamyl-tRNA reductase [Trichinella spiralis]|uniref:Glutamyl-tRNA reductase n=1 Tax=Trichinella spiralis TaxID=6334 RepID=A0ABR3L4B0_TRISP